tara:strand:+ start:14758 stop:15543 length:786 start_codon:yes stop_codon:yes gene_type:complete
MSASIKNKKKILLIGKNSNSTRILYNYLKQNHSINVIIESSSDPLNTIYRKFKLFGFIYTVGYIPFLIFSKFYLKFYSKNRINEILSSNGLHDIKIPEEKIYHTKSINSDHCRNIIKNLKPNFVLVSGTKIVGKKTLEIKSVKFINIHAGITPDYRGVHGAYWALVNNDKNFCGVTLHFLDSGVDTGNIIAQNLINVEKNDNFSTYPFIQLVSGIKLLENFLNNGQLRNNTNVITDYKKSKQYTHPTICNYLYNYIFKGVK